MKYYVGIDIGSTSVKLAIVDDQGKLVESLVRASGGSYHKTALEAYEALLQKANVTDENVEYMISTGYGRKLFKNADESISEITANAIGARGLGDDQVQTVINIGGQDLKVIALDEEGNCTNFVMNDKCAAGTGRFLEMVAVNLEVDIEDLADLHQNFDGVPATINSTCTVFADSEIIGLLANGHSKEEVVQGVHYSIARRIVRLAKRVGLHGTILFDGGPAMNQGLVQAIEVELMREVKVPETPQITTAFGAALLARREIMDSLEETNKGVVEDGMA